MSVQKRIISKKTDLKITDKTNKTGSFPQNNRGLKQNQELPKPKKVCPFCTDKNEPTYTDIVNLKRFANDRGMIVTKLRTGACSKHQRRITKEIKHARHLALLPFVPKI